MLLSFASATKYLFQILPKLSKRAALSSQLSSLNMPNVVTLGTYTAKVTTSVRTELSFQSCITSAKTLYRGERYPPLFNAVC